MLHAIKHTAVRLWLSIVIGGLSILWVLPLAGAPIVVTQNVAWTAAILLLAFLAVGWVMNRLGERAVQQYTGSGMELERAGSVKEAEAIYQKIVSLFDSFLLSPRLRKQHSRQAVEQLARFYLARADRNLDSERFIVSHLNNQPDDREAAETWLSQSGGRGWLPEAYLELAARIGEAQPRNRRIQRLLARFYSTEERTDFAALQTYRRVMEQKDSHASKLAVRLASIFLREGRADEWAMAIYIHAYQANFTDPELLGGIAACMHWREETDQNRELFEAGRRLLDGEDPARLAAMRSRFNPPAPEPLLETPEDARRSGAAAFAALWRQLASLLKGCGAAARAAYGVAEKAVHLFRTSVPFRRAVQWGMAGVVAVAAVALVINTADYLLKPESGDEKKSLTFPVEGRFTVQVAAYLKPEHAERFMAKLREKGVAAYWIQTKRGGKAWYQVRVSRFPDKNSARAYGESLKVQGIIEDFYIANFVPPARR